jgi:hypothetical protein
MHQPIQNNPLNAMASQSQARQLELTCLFNSSCSSEVRGGIAKEVH